MSWLEKLNEYIFRKFVKPEPRKMPLVYCVDCEEVREATQAMRCSNCGSDATTLMTQWDVIRGEEKNKYQFRD